MAKLDCDVLVACVHDEPHALVDVRLGDVVQQLEVQRRAASQEAQRDGQLDLRRDELAALRQPRLLLIHNGQVRPYHVEQLLEGGPRESVALLELVLVQPAQVVVPREGGLAPLLSLRALPAGKEGG